MFNALIHIKYVLISLWFTVIKLQVRHLPVNNIGSEYFFMATFNLIILRPK